MCNLIGRPLTNGLGLRTISLLHLLPGVFGRSPYRQISLSEVLEDAPVVEASAQQKTSYCCCSSKGAVSSSKAPMEGSGLARGVYASTMQKTMQKT